jgi:3-oxoacyl-[acyl-carrier-protein] synthase-3
MTGASEANPAGEAAPANPTRLALSRTVGAVITGTGMAIPSRVVPNSELEAKVETSDDWIVQRTGIKQRHVCADGEQTSDLAAAAVTQALTRASLKPTDLDLLICATMTPDMVCPAAAPLIVSKIGAVPCGAFDVNVACSGFVAALNIAASFVASGMYRNVAVVGAEQMSAITDWNDRRTCILFGDGAGAAIISADADTSRGCLYQSIHSDGNKWAELYCPREQSHVPAGSEFNGGFDTLQMNGREVYKFAVTTLQSCVSKAMAACGLTPADVAMVIPHQSNARIIESAREKLGFSEEKIYVNIHNYGNTSAASVGICLHELMAAGRLKRGDVVIFAGMGGGLTWATSVWKL